MCTIPADAEANSEHSTYLELGRLIIAQKCLTEQIKIHSEKEHFY